MQRRLIVPMLLLMIFSLMAAGCGDDGSSNGNEANAANGGGESGQLTKAQFIKKAEALCERGTEKALEEILPEMERRKKRSSGAQKNIGELHSEAIVAVMLPEFEDQIDQIRSLGFPAGDERELNRFLTTMQRSIDATRQDPPRAKGVARVGVEFRNKFIPLDKLGRAYGFNRCAYGGLR